MKKLLLSLLCLCLGSFHAQSQELDIPDTGISGVYEVMVGVEDPAYAIKYFGEFGFRIVDSARFSAEKAKSIYGVEADLKSYRLQNGDIDSHGLLRILVWDKPLGPGVGYTAPETIGQRMAVMLTKDIFRLHDIYQAAEEAGGKWLPIQPIADDLFNLDNGKKDFFNRPVIVRETGIYGEFFNHVFFQRYGYNIPGYGTIDPETKLKTSEFTHHDFIIQADKIEDMSYMATALGLKPEGEPSIDGYWQKGPRRVFQMEAGYSHHYWGFVSPNNICGKLKFFLPRAPRPDRSAHQRVGEMGITLHSFYTPKLEMVHRLVQEHGLNPKAITENEFGERSFFFSDKAGVSWQIIEEGEIKNTAVKELKF